MQNEMDTGFINPKSYAPEGKSVRVQINANIMFGLFEVAYARTIR